MATTTWRKADEIRARRILERRGLRLERCRRRDPAAEGFGLYRVVNNDGETLTGAGYRLTLEQAEAWAERARPRRSSRRTSTVVPEDGTVRLLVGDALRVLERIPDAQFQCCVTSPPYWRQRDYGVRGQIGDERSPAEWADRLVAVFREVRRTLRHDGLLWVIVGDAYNTRSKIRPSSHQPSLNGTPDERWADAARRGRTRLPLTTGGLKGKDLLGLPWELAFALRADGWYLRSAVVWHKAAHLPDPARDRPASSYEHVLMLAKAPRYFYDADGIAEPAAPRSAARYTYEFGNAQPGRPRTAVRGRREHDGLRNARNVWSIPATGVGGEHPAMMPQELAERCIRASTRPGDHVLDPFGGLGTTALAASALGRMTTLVELSPKYAAAARKRLGKLLLARRG
jgi:DNA modification methylase